MSLKSGAFLFENKLKSQWIGFFQTTGSIFYVVCSPHGLVSAVWKEDLIASSDGLGFSFLSVSEDRRQLVDVCGRPIGFDTILEGIVQGPAQTSK